MEGKTLYLVRWGESKEETICFNEEEGLMDYLTTHNFDPAEIEVLLVMVVRELTWEKTVELK